MSTKGAGVCWATQNGQAANRKEAENSKKKRKTSLRGDRLKKSAIGMEKKKKISI